MTSFKYALLAILFTLLMSQCKNTKTTSESAKTYQEIASDWLGEGYQCEANTTESMMLCSVKTELPNRAGRGVKFLVYDQENQTVIYKDSIDKGTVSWFNDTELAMFYTPGIMRAQQTRDDYTFIYNLKTNEKIKKTKMN